MPEKTDRELVTSKAAYRIHLDPGTATLDSVIAAIKQLGGRHGCEACGRLGYIDIGFEERVNPRDIAGIRSIVDLATKTEIR
ncbi:MAG: hypothetical protein JNL82_40685 [Myxococcales bacterium]|nr:hypothetical protein [Myxococcales bacterium]